MPEDDVCPHGDHVAPRTGGSCPCGLVTLVPAAPRPASGDSEVRDLIARCLVERGGVDRGGVERGGVDRGGVADLTDLRRRADRVLGALAAAGLVLAPRPTADRVAGRRSA